LIGKKPKNLIQKGNFFPKAPLRKRCDPSKEGDHYHREIGTKRPAFYPISGVMKYQYSGQFHFLLIILLGMSGCRSTGPGTGNNRVTIPVQYPLVGHGIHQMPADSGDLAYLGLRNSNQLFRFYRDRHLKSFWFSETGSNPIADSMRRAIDYCRYDGLIPQDFHLTELDSLRRVLATESEMIRIELLLSDAFISMSKQLTHGRIRGMGIEIKDTTLFAQFSLLKTKADVHSVLRLMEPEQHQYLQLKSALRIILDSLSEPTRLQFLKGDTGDTLPGSKQIRAIEINLERWRNEPEQMPGKYILVNIPAYKVEAWVEEKPVWSSRVIVGDPETPTPELSSQIECIVTYPYWNVPRKIAVEEYLPILRQNTSFLSRNNMDVFNHRGIQLNPDSVPWKDFTNDYFPVSIRQREGSDNSLGLIKFVFDNPYAVYLHDTNSKRRFSDSCRALSHGCVRVEKATELAHYLITGSLSRRSKLVERSLNLQEQRFIDLPQPWSVYIRYFTCEWNDGRLSIYKDIYQKDDALTAELYDFPCAKQR
jgi:murein L,D-transpeptidase YcbB/YkuD